MSQSVFEMWLLDVSGSMAGKRFDLLREAVKVHRASAPHVRLITFATDIRAIESTEEFDKIICNGGTNLHLALEYAAEMMCGKVVVYTDGEPHDEKLCFEAATKVPGVVDTIFCGDSDDREAKRFCDKLSRDNGGKFVFRDILKGETLLCKEVRELLSLPSPIAL